LSVSTLDKVVNEVVSEALREYQEALNKAREEAFSILEQAGNEVSNKVHEIIETEKRKRESLRQRIISLAEINARNKKIAVLEEGVNNVINEALRRIENIQSESELEQILKNLLLEAVNAIQSKEIIVQTNERSQKILEKVAREVEKSEGVKIIVDKNVINTICGVRARSSDGMVIYDNTVETRVERNRQRIRKELAALFTS